MTIAAAQGRKAVGLRAPVLPASLSQEAPRPSPSLRRRVNISLAPRNRPRDGIHAPARMPAARMTVAEQQATVAVWADAWNRAIRLII